jgi:predicted Zn finger-like uncharacterized protein
MTMKTVVGYLVSAVFLFFAVLYALASGAEPALATTRLSVSAFLFVAGFLILFLTWRLRPMQTVQKLEITGDVKAEAIKCPNCSASIDVNKIKIVDGAPMATCSYCGHVFQITEEPKW